MTRAVRVLVVDDSVVVRRLVTRLLDEDPGIEVAGVAADGRRALAVLPQVHPDVVVLDVEMPELDGLATLAAIRERHPHVRVIMFSSLTERGAATTLEALALGASDYVTKPPALSPSDAVLDEVREQLVTKVRVLGDRSERARAGAGAPPARGWQAGPARPVGPVPAAAAPRHRAERVEVVAVGSSTGGPNALGELLAGLPADFPAPVLIVQHMPPLFTRMLAERLDAGCPLTVAEAVPGAELRPGEVWLAPGGRHLLVERQAGVVRLATSQAPPENSCRPSVDVLFRSVSAAYGDAALGVVLTGMGRDGVAGSAALRAGGGQVLVQDKASSVVWGMPGLVAEAGMADQVVPLDQLAAELCRRVRPDGRARAALRLLGGEQAT
ncbi:MAG TPA: chemotaxis response regulator protein-glutamate methylesterase [Actinomycetes bacterium]